MVNIFGENRIANILILMRKSSVTDIYLLADQLGVSTRTVRNDIKTLNEMLEDSGVIEVDQGRCSLRIFDPVQFQTAFSHIVTEDDSMNSAKHRRDYIFGKLMRAFNPLLTDDLAYEMNIGRSTMVKDLNRLRTEIEPYNLSIIGKTSKGLMLQGSELDIRRYVMENNYDEIYREYPQDDDILDIVESCFSQKDLDWKVEELFNSYLTLMLDRFMTGHYIGRLPETFYNLTSRKEFEFIDHLINRLGNMMHVEFPLEEKIFVFLPIIGMRTPDDTEKMQQFELDETMRPLLKEIIDAIEMQFDLDVNLDDYTEEFMYHLMFMINRLKYNVRIENMMADAVRQKYPIASKMADIAAGIIERRYHVKVNNEELGYLTSYFSVFLSDNDEKEQRIAIVSASGKVTARLVYAQLRKIIDSSTVVDLFTDDDMRPSVLNTYDLVLSTTDLPFRCQVPVIRIREVFNENELRNRIAKIRYLQPQGNELIDDNWFVMTSILKEDFFFVLEDKTYEEAMHTMIQSLQQKGYLDEDFEERLAEREAQGTMVLGNKAAIPHTFNLTGEHLLLAIGVLPEPVKYQNMDIQLIFLLALPEENTEDDLLIRIYDEILAILNDPELMDRIISADSYPNLLRVLYKRN
ncbi:BglG family transcription antiterminator [Catenisphaera adipataccumulans]|jgi:lichenan operon transcriptional antiterminator|uniref:Lichenan operon transcriptional antiterminator n=1 Tax=Catenisphaera adipataccumulans TaxID=700500 RepID=A0A7W8FVH3_9FIRM|nr:PTS sugar transporter subunit IIA [Catenisphaera adipataccumulans]MBB5183143.1 lichenan operon transcriptional antiterminator [Catenisphaera adipataccumulans]